MVQRRAPPVPEIRGHLPGCPSCSLLASGLEFLGTHSLVLPHAGLYLFGNLFPADYIQRNESWVVTASTFMRFSDKRVVEFKRNLILAWAQPAFLVALGVVGGQAGLCLRLRRT